MIKRFFYSLLPLVSLLLLAGCLQNEKLLDHQSTVLVTAPEPVAELPAQINLGVPFFSQAPFGDWGIPYQEACEEASLLLAYYYKTGQTPNINQFHADELALVDWEIATFGQYEHTSIEQTAQIARDYLNYPIVELFRNPTVDDLKGILAAGHPIVAPFAGRYLGNPYFTGAGPVYHMLVIRGYDDSHFITNDVGTRNGQNFIYTYDVLMNALHDWHDDAATDPQGILKGEKVVLVLK